MRGFRHSLIVLFALATLSGASTLHAGWMQDGTVVCAAGDNQEWPAMIPDGEGGAFITWMDYRSATIDIYANRIDRFGDALWAPNGVPICTASGDQYYPRIISDYAGGAIITWHDGRGTYWDIYAQRIDPDGNVLWTADGAGVCTETWDSYYPELAPDLAGGAIIAWIDNRMGNFDIFAQRINANGSKLWFGYGNCMCAASGNQIEISIIPNAVGSAILVWEDNRSGNTDVYANRTYADGNVAWGANGTAVCTATGGQNEPVLVSDGAGGAIFSWSDYRNGNADIYAQRFTSAGSAAWTNDGVPLCAASNTQTDPRIATDGGGAIIAWWDYRSGSNYDIYAQRVDPDGNALWSADGIAVCTAANNQSYVELGAYGAGGTVAAWYDYRGGSSGDIYAQRLDEMGNALWAADGIAVCCASGDQEQPRVVCDGSGNALVAWYDGRISGNENIYAQRLDPKGNWGFPAPRIAFVRDVPGDEGGNVTTAWHASQYDPLGQITRYTIWRSIAAPMAALLTDGGARLLTSAADIPPTADGRLIRVELRGGTTYFWELIGSQDAYYLESYSKLVPTAFDSTAACDEYEYFQIIAHTSAPLTFWVSEPDSGYSVDNLSPCPPLGLAGEQQYEPAGLLLSWDPNVEPDLDGYVVHRGLTEDFMPGPGNLLASPCDTFLIDGEWRWDTPFFYKVAAVDVHGNTSGFALLRPVDVTGADTPGVPRSSFLAQNVPNPFNPSTTLRFGLRESAHVTLRIYDAAGRLVRTLVDDHRPAGLYDKAWDGRDAAGRASASGVYFCKLVAGRFEETRKIVLLK
jgi:hypothetical protein